MADTDIFRESEIKPHKKLDLWKKSIDFTMEIYKICKKLPKEELYGISSQLKRAAYSIPSNIAEGSSRQTRKEFIQFLYIARGSCSELDTFIEISRKAGWISDIEKITLDRKIIDISKMITGLINHLKKKMI